MGGEPSWYRRAAPPHSHIHVDDFDSPKQLADYLNFLDNNEDEYMKYFKWKSTGIISDVKMWCRVCALLHAPLKTKFYDNFDDWWRGNDVCIRSSWRSNNSDLVNTQSVGSQRMKY